MREERLHQIDRQRPIAVSTARQLGVKKKKCVARFFFEPESCTPIPTIPDDATAPEDQKLNLPNTYSGQYLGRAHFVMSAGMWN